MVISGVYRGYQIAKKVYGYGKPVITGKSFVSKFPPQHRKTVQTVLTAGERAFTGGLVADILKSLNDDGTTNNDYAVPSKKGPSPSNFQTRGRFRRGAKWCRCKPKRYSKRRQRKKYSY